VISRRTKRTLVVSLVSVVMLTEPALVASSRDTKITDEKKHEASLSKAQQLRSEQEVEIATLGQTFAWDPDGTNPFSKLSPYETTIEPQLYKALRELERR
jgi:hypothetical protein